MPMDSTHHIGRAITSDHRIHHGRWTGPASYVAGGEPNIRVALDLPNRIESFPGFVALTAAGAVLAVVYDATNDTLRWFGFNGTEQVAGADLSAYTGDFIAIGI